MRQVAELARQSGLDMIPAEWGQTKTFPVPCIVHWKENHYAAILEQRNGTFLVVDPTFGKPRWLLASDVIEEASGYFIVPRDKLPKGWRALGQSETEHIAGRGTSGFITDTDDSCGNGSGGGDPGGTSGGGGGGGGMGLNAGLGMPCCGGGGAGGGGGGGGGGGVCTTCDTGSGQGGSGSSDSSNSGNEAGLNTAPGHGMPIWAVSEPYINVWLYDEPLGYQPGLGYRVSFKLAYKQRESRTISTNVFGLGPMWDCSWISFVEDTSPTYGTTATMFVPKGGVRDYTSDGSVMDFFSHTLLTRYPQAPRTTMTNYVETYADGAKDYYGFVPSTVQIDMNPVAFLTCKIDPYGHTTQFIYQETNNSVKLLYVVDGDGRTNTLSYTNSTFPTLITGVTDPFGRTAILQYDNNGMLTNAVDVAGLTNAFNYDGQGWLTLLNTPYGSTSFQNYTNANSTNEFGLNSATNYNPFLPIRAVKIVDPVGGTNIYMLRQDSSIAYTNPADYYNNTNNYIPFLPTQYSSLIPFGPTTTLDTNSDCYLFYRDSFHWGPRQASGLPVDFTTFAPTNFYRARMRHWLHNGSFDTPGVSQILDIEQEPSADGMGFGQTTFYDYDGKTSANWISTTESLPSLIARVVPDGTTWYSWLQRDQWGRPTNVVQTYSTSYGTAPLTRTNVYIYDASGANLVQVIGPAGETLAGYAYDTTNQLLRATNAVGDVRYLTYDAMGRITSEKSEAGLTHTNIYFSSGSYTNWVQTAIDLEIDRTNAFTYTNDLPYTVTDERGLTTTFTYDNLQRMLTSTDTRGSITYRYNKLDMVQKVDRLGFTNNFGYDALRRLTASTNALGYYILYNYCACGALDSVRDAAGNFTYFYYDNLGRLTNTIFADNFTISRQYNILGQLTNVSDSAGLRLTNWFNNQGLKYAVSNAFGQSEALTFDLEDRITNSIDANGVSETMTYDNLGRVLTRSYPDGGSEKFGYAAAGLIAYTNQLGYTNFYAYDPAQRKIFETNANWELTQFQYTPAGDLTNLIDGKLQSTKWNYDQYGRVTNKVDSSSNAVFVYSYDGNNHLTNRWTPAKGATAYRYDPVGNVTNVIYPLNTTIVLGYDALDRLTNMVDAVGTTIYSYSAIGQLLSEDGPWADDTVSYIYTNRLRASLSLQEPNSSAWTEGFGYDGIKRFSTISSPAGTFGYAYANGTPSTLVSQLTLPNGASITNRFDSVARLLSTVLKNSSNTILNAHQYGYDLAGERLWMTNTTLDYHGLTYDKIGQLVGASGYESNGTSRLQEQFGYAYDSAHNLNGRTNNAFWENFSVNNLNELSTISRSTTNLTVAGTTTSSATNVTVNGLTANRYADNTFALGGFPLVDGNNNFMAVAQDALNRKDTNSIAVNLPANSSCTYDLNGNLVSDGSRNFAYDDENQLISVWVTNTWRSDFVYDAKLRRRMRFESTWNGSAWITNSEVHYIYDGKLAIQERYFDPQLATTAPVKTISYTRGRDLSGSREGAGGIGGLLARTDSALLNAASSLAHSFYHADGNGNVTALISYNQTLAAKYLYDAFGNIISQAGSLAQDNLYRFSSREEHLPSGLVHYLFRFYDPNLQRWLRTDPAQESGFQNLDHSQHQESFSDGNLFTFIDNAPLGNIDSFGLMPDWPGWPAPKRPHNPPAQKPMPKKPVKPPIIYPPGSLIIQCNTAPGGIPTQPYVPPAQKPPPKKNPCENSADWGACFNCMTENGANSAQAADYCNHKFPQ